MIPVVNFGKRNYQIPNYSLNCSGPEINAFLWIDLILFIGREKQLILWYKDASSAKVVSVVFLSLTLATLQV